MFNILYLLRTGLVSVAILTRTVLDIPGIGVGVTDILNDNFHTSISWLSVWK